eukprot:gnl/Carplike_NY0171/8554_a11864_168.p1 GENE.gnl/Carplike_NY0171/8554_a11864_168~~gnl/Carplike_NY0171/8554_a11864_168.p1  ORF type:complete len:104 (+),score=1.92 gnl/Carplike_NY0171/8554_a11864_168:267-578(+)
MLFLLKSFYFCRCHHSTINYLCRDFCDQYSRNYHRKGPCYATKYSIVGQISFYISTNRKYFIGSILQSFFVLSVRLARFHRSNAVKKNCALLVSFVVILSIEK